MKTNRTRGAVGMLGAAIAACLLAATTFSAAAADDHGKPASKIVKFDDLNPSVPADAAKLRSRIHLAAKQVCERLDGRSAGERVRWNQCVADATDNALAQIDRTLLSRR